MAESKMKEVAKILGVELGEEFKIKGYDGIFKLTNDGLSDGSCILSLNLNLLLNGECEIEKTILDKVEKEYLENILKPFKDMVTYVEKVNSNHQQQYLYIYLKGYEIFDLPYFKENTMYVGMKPGKQYTLKELGLFEK